MHKTKSGFEYELEPEKLNDMRLIDLLASDEEDMTVISKIVSLLFNKKDKDRLYAHVAETDGRIPADRIADEVSEIFESQGERGKNSLPLPE